MLACLPMKWSNSGFAQYHRGGMLLCCFENFKAAHLMVWIPCINDLLNYILLRFSKMISVLALSTDVRGVDMICCHFCYSKSLICSSELHPELPSAIYYGKGGDSCLESNDRYCTYKYI